MTDFNEWCSLNKPTLEHDSRYRQGWCNGAKAMHLNTLNKESVFELVEHTSEEAYHPIGIYRTYEEAKAVIKKADSDNKPVYEYSSEDCGEPEIIKILERQFGESENGDTIYSCTRENMYSEQNDEYCWEITQDFEITEAVRSTT